MSSTLEDELLNENEVMEDMASSPTEIENQQKIQVFLRLKPLPGSEVSVIDGTGPRNIRIVQGQRENIPKVVEYQFDWVFPGTSSQEDTFKKSCPSLLKTFFSGENALLFCYGPSGSGKTFTIQGDNKRPGILPRVLQSIFRSIENGTPKAQPSLYPGMETIYLENLNLYIFRFYINPNKRRHEIYNANILFRMLQRKNL